MMIRSKPSLRAFTLIEIVVAAMILAVTVVGVFSVFISGNKFIFRAGRRLSAVNIIQGEIEKRRQYVRFDTWNDNTPSLNPELNKLQITDSLPSEWTDPSLGNIPVKYLPGGQYLYKVEQDSQFSDPVPSLPASQACRKSYMRVLWNEPKS